jgi:hypothetical protein
MHSSKPSASAISDAPAQVARPSSFVTGLVLVLGLTVLQLLRQPGEPSWSSVWQEDGSVFLTDAIENPVAAIFEPYAGYLHVVPRLIAQVVAVFPLEWAAALLSVSSSVIVALLALYVYRTSASMLSSEWTRLTIALLFVLVPASAYETNANITNLHWYLDFAAFWALFSRPRTRAEIAAATAIVGFAVLSDPLMGLLAPLALLYLWETRRSPASIVPLVFGATLLLQFVVGVVEEPPDPFGRVDATEVPAIYALRVAGSVVVGDLFLDNFWNRFGLGFAWSAFAIVAVAAALGVIGSRGAHRRFVLASLAVSVLFLAIPLLLRGTENFLNRGAAFNLNGSRYTLLPVLFLLVGLLAGAEGWRERLGPTRWRNLQLGVGTFLAILVVVNYANFAVRTAGPNWGKSLQASRDLCRTSDGRLPGEREPLEGAYFPLKRQPGEVRVPIAPNLPPYPFAFVIDCQKLD